MAKGTDEKGRCFGTVDGVTLEERRAMCELQWVWLDDGPARICGYLLPFAYVTMVDPPWLSVSWSWSTVKRIVDRCTAENVSVHFRS